MDKQPEETGNIYADQWKEYKNSKLSERLKGKYRPRPYYERRASLRLLAVIVSYAFNVLSAFTAAVPVFLFVQYRTESVAASVVASLVFILLLEIAKRITTRAVFKEWYLSDKVPPLAALVVLLTLLSVSFSFFGGEKLVIKTAPAPAQTIDTDSIKTAYAARVDSLQNIIDAARNVKYRSGNTTRESREEIVLLTQRISKIETEGSEEVKTAKAENKAIMTNSATDTQHTARTFALLTLLCEFMFLLSLWYCEYYDFRADKEMQLIGAQVEKGEAATPATDNETPTPSMPIEETPKPTTPKVQRKPRPKKSPPTTRKKPPKELRQNPDYIKLKKKLSAYKSKLKKGKGNAATNKAGLERAQIALEEMENAA